MKKDVYKRQAGGSFRLYLFWIDKCSRRWGLYFPEMCIRDRRSAARSAWEHALSAITVKGGNTDDLKNFYTDMYHSMVVPNLVSHVNGEYRSHDMEIGHLPKGKVQYLSLIHIYCIGFSFL